MKKFKRKIIFFVIFILAILFLYSNITKDIFPLKYEEYIVKYSNEFALDPYLVAAVIRAESNFKKDALSHKEAKGLMQITPTTGKWIYSNIYDDDFKIDMLLNPDTNIKMGCWYLNNLREEFNGNMALVLAAYNAGRGNVQKWLKNDQYSDDGKNLKSIPFGETEKYIKRVNLFYKIYKFVYGNKLSSCS